MSADYAPGTVAVATVRGVKGVLVAVVGSAGHSAPWISLHDTIDGHRWHASPDVTDVRPLVVLDLEGAENTKDTAALLREIIGHWPYGQTHYAGGAYHLTLLADQIEAQTKPPRIPEPQGLGAIVRNGAGLRWVRAHTNAWVSEEGVLLHWDDLIDPTLIRDGVTP